MLYYLLQSRLFFFCYRFPIFFYIKVQHFKIKTLFFSSSFRLLQLDHKYTKMVQTFDLPVLSLAIPNINKLNEINVDNLSQMWTGKAQLVIYR